MKWTRKEATGAPANDPSNDDLQVILISVRLRAASGYWLSRHEKECTVTRHAGQLDTVFHMDQVVYPRRWTVKLRRDRAWRNAALARWGGAHENADVLDPCKQRDPCPRPSTSPATRNAEPLCLTGQLSEETRRFRRMTANGPQLPPNVLPPGRVCLCLVRCPRVVSMMTRYKCAMPSPGLGGCPRAPAAKRGGSARRRYPRSWEAGDRLAAPKGGTVAGLGYAQLVLGSPVARGRT